MEFNHVESVPQPQRYQGQKEEKRNEKKDQNYIHSYVMQYKGLHPHVKPWAIRIEASSEYRTSKLEWTQTYACNIYPYHDASFFCYYLRRP